MWLSHGLAEASRRHPINHSSLLILAMLALATLATLACDGLRTPPVEVLQRDSLVGIGKILIVSNPGAEALDNVHLQFENPNGDIKNYEVGALAAGESIEVGWKKLDGFEVSENAKVEVRADGYRTLYLDLGKD